MAQWKYECEGIGAYDSGLSFGLLLKGDGWVRFGTLFVPFDMFESYHLQPLIAAWTDRMEGPPEEDTPLWNTQQ